jgi:signal transduction histidine kinase
MNRITVKWLLTIFGVMVIGFTLIGLTSYRVVANYYQSYLEQNIVNQAHSYAEILKINFNPKALEQIKKMEKEHTSSVFVFSPQKKLLATSEPTDKLDIIHLTQQWIQKNSKENLIQKEVGAHQTKVLLAKNPIYQGKTFLGTLVMVTELSWLDHMLGSLQIMLFLTVIGALFIASGLGLILSRKVVKPILDIGRAMKELSKGNYQIRLEPIPRKDELSHVIHQVNQLAKNLDYYSSSRRDFLSDVAHELRTPITYVKGYTSLLHQSKVKPELSKKLIHIIQEQSNRLEQLVNDLVTLSRLDEGKVELKTEKVEICDLLQKIVWEMTPYAEKSGITLTLQAPNPVYLWIDPHRFYQIWTNLIDNALRYSHKQGNVTIIIYQKANWTTIQVIDEGMGISREQLDRIWDRFYRIEKSRSRHTGGSGLGLAIVKNLVHLHGGRIYVDSVVEQGTTFTVIFPNERSE